MRIVAIVVLTLIFCTALNPVPVVYLWIRLRHGRKAGEDYMVRLGIWRREDL